MEQALFQFSIMSKPIIELKKLSKHYKNFVAVDELDLVVTEGDVFGFLGPNGAGKSTTIRMLLSLIQPSSGEIFIFGKNLRTNRSEILREIGCIIEKPDFYLYLSAIKNLEIFARMNGISPSRSKLEEMLETVGLKGRENDVVKTYSHGMKQRLGIAQTLIHNPSLIVLDEPTTGLDPQGIIDLRNLILQLKKEQGKTIVLSSHILSEIELIADSMVIINNGKSMAQGKVSDLMSHENLIVTLEVKNGLEAIPLLESSEWKKSIQTTQENLITLHISKNEIPSLQTFLSEKNIAIFSLTYKRTLEDFFLKLTSHQ